MKMVSPPSGSKAVELLVIESDIFTLSIKGSPVHPNVQALGLNNSEGNFKKSHISFEALIDQNYKVYIYDHSSNNLIPYNKGQIEPFFFEQTNYEIILEVKKENNQYSLTYDNSYSSDIVTPTGKSGRVYSGVINFRNDVGFSRFVLKENEEEIFAFEIEVFPSKLDYLDDFQQMLQEVNQEVYNLAFDFLRKTFLSTTLTQEETPSEAEFFTIISTIFDKFCDALERVRRQPHHKIVPLNRVVRPEKAKRTNKETMRWLQKRPYVMQKSYNKGISINNTSYIPKKVLDSKKELSYDTYENRFLKWILLIVDRRLKRFSEKIKKEKLDANDDLLDKIYKMRTKIRNFINNSFLQNVGNLHRLEKSSLVMQMGAGYRDVYKYYLMIQKGLNISSDIFNMSLKDIAVLYEYWCFLKLNALLRNKYNLVSNNLVTLDRSGIVVRLQKGEESQLKYHDPKTNEEFIVSYNRAFNNLPTIGQHPDNILSLKKSDSNVRYQYVFDAKYRLDTSSEYKVKFNQIGPPVDTINAMHRYRDAIVANNKNNDNYTRDIFGAFVLFPHNNENAFAGIEDGKPSKFYDSISEISIGALPFLPSQTKLVENFLDDLLLESSDTAFERSVVQKGTKSYYDKKEQINDVLIGPLKRSSQLEVCLENNMYYTYLDQVKNQLGLIKYVAIYQSKRKFYNTQKQGIFYYGKVSEYYILPRKNITEAEKATHPDRLAVKFVVDEWKSLDHPIQPRGYGPKGPQFTNWYIFNEAKTYPELHLTWEEMRLLKELRRIEKKTDVKFPKDTITITDRFEILEFPGLVVERKDRDNFEVITKSENQLFEFRELQLHAKTVLKEIISMWFKT
ncbi:restriction endonuclease-like protein [Natranaerobius trueperi]|uniref:DUF2357 domain-containing protein n=1 Tax=Natranaerobius trueperi TaxID=759412 RepID=A0A226BYN6_9FIRM|nr:restriction endonuclease-like protein [Natranaerobius trueperi]OWZ84116.1 hypothetical protein CDO51_05215 [Natranaerobius trueperi]